MKNCQNELVGLSTNFGVCGDWWKELFGWWSAYAKDVSLALK